MENRNKFLTAEDMRGLTHISQTMLDKFSDVVNPANNGRGHGFHRKYSLVDAVAIGYGKRMLEWGLKPVLVLNLVSSLAKLSQRELETKLADGNTVALPLSKNEIWWDNPLEKVRKADHEFFELINLKTTYDDIRGRAEELIAARRVLARR